MTLLERWTRQMVSDAADSLVGRKLVQLPVHWHVQQYCIGVIVPKYGEPPDDLLAWSERPGYDLDASHGPAVAITRGSLHGVFAPALEWVVGTADVPMPMGALESIRMVDETTDLIMRGIMAYDVSLDQTIIRFDVFVR